MANTGQSPDDHRQPSDVKFDALVDQVHEVASQLKETAALVDRLISQEMGKQVQQIIHKTEGSSFASVVAACISAACVIILLASLIVLVPDIHDLKAWKDVHSNDIAALKADTRQLKEKIK